MANGQSINITVNTATAEQDLAELAKKVNDFLSGLGANGKKVRLLDLSADRAELEELIEKFKEVINMSASIRGPLNMAGQGAGNRPTIPSQMAPMPGESLEGLEKRITAATARLLQHHFSTSAATAPGASPGASPGAAPGSSPNGPGQHGQAAGGRESHPWKDQLFKGSSALGHMAHQISPLLGGVGGALGRAGSMGAEGYVGRGLAGFAGGGMAGMAAGAGIGLLGYGLYKGASAVNEGVDREKVLATDIDKFRRSLGGTSESFDKLRDQSRMIGDAFNLTYLESRNISTEFAKIAKSNVGSIDQALEGVGMAQAVGADEAQGSGFMANLRRDQSIGDKKSDARLMAVQFAEALRRTGSTLNAGDLMTAIQGFSGDTARRGLSAPNVEGYAGLLSAIVGGKIPGLDVNGAGSLIGRADSSFQGGGGAGQASNTLQYMALGGDKVGLMGAQMREAAGMFASNDSVFGNKNSPVNQYTGGSMLKHKGSSSGLEDVIGMIKANSGGNKELEIMTLARHLKLNPNEAATFLNMQGQGQLGGMLGLASQYEGVDLGKMSSAGYNTLADVQKANGDTSELGKVRDGLSARSGLTKDQSAQLAAMKGMGGNDLQDALVKFSTTMEREKTDGEQIKSAAVKTANATDRLAENLIPASIMTNNLMSSLVQRFAPNSPYLKEMEMQKFKDRVALPSESFKSGQVPDSTVADLNADYARDLSRPMLPGNGVTTKSRMDVLEKQYRQMGDKMVTPHYIEKKFADGQIDAMKKRVDAERTPANSPESTADVRRKAAPDEAAGGSPTRTAASGVVTPEMRAKMLANDAELAKIHPGWAPGMTEAQIKQESNFNPKALSHAGAQGYTQIMPGTRRLFEKRTGRKFEAGNFDDDLALHKLHMTDDLRREGNVPDALRAYNNGPKFRNSNSRENREYAGGVLSKHAALPPEAKAATIPPNDPAKAAANAAESQRLHVSLGEQKSSVTVNLVGAPGSGQPDQSVTSSGTSKAQPAGSISSDARKYRA